MIERSKIAAEIDDPIVAEALKHFKASVDTWSEAAYSRSRMVRGGMRTSWRLAASWALGCLLAAGSVAGALYERHVRQESARIAAVKAAEQKAALERKAAEQPVAVVTKPARPVAVKRAADEDENLLATVDSDVSRQVPSAMEPLAQMMESSGAN
ncbi:MAG TPA: hypothetical protein VGG45_12700 [Terracidiphilus sp.]|jgi:hypothetical protein